MKTKTLLFLFIITASILSAQNNKTDKKEPVDLVNPYMGNISHLLVPTYPTVHLPNSMLRVIPMRSDFTSERLNGLPIATTSHRGRSAFTINPISGPGDNIFSAKAYSYDHEHINPYSYDVFLDEEQVQVAFAVAQRSGIYVFDFKESSDKSIFLTNENGNLSVTGNSISGYMDISGNDPAIETKLYLYLESESPAKSFGITENGKMTTIASAEGKNIGAALSFGESQKPLKVKYGISFISVAQAKKNLEREIPDFDPQKVLDTGRKVWNTALAKTTVKGGSKDDQTVFYTSVYRTYERPICISEDGRYYSAFDGKIHEDDGKPFYTDDWIWDTYRATHPLRVLTEKELELNIIRSYIRMAEQMDNLWMPTFPEINGDSRRMNSNHGVATILDAYTKGITDFDLEKAYTASKNAITEKTLAPWSAAKSGDLDAFYVKNGYIPALAPGEKETIPEVNGWEKRQPVAVTLGTAYDEWCLSQIAKILGKKKDEDYFLGRSYNYRNLYNAKTGFFHPKDAEGNFIEPFDYRYAGGLGARDYYGENNAYIYRWDVPHNIGDLMDLMGGREKFVDNLEATFTEPLGRSKYQFYSQLPDHTGNVGQFSMANEPSLHIPYLYNYAGQPWKTQKAIKKLVHEWFRNDLMGVPGDEDGGGMSAFVAFSMMGFYPVTPGSATYTIGSPFFDRAAIDMGDGKTFTIIANNLSPDNKYIQKATLNGKVWDKPWFDHSEIKDGGTLELEMGPYANRSWGSGASAVPPSAEKM